MTKNKLLIAAAGSGKTTYLIERANEAPNDNVLITTYTEANDAEIRKKFKWQIPKNITIQTWFSFLLQHGVRPYQDVLFPQLFNKRIGFLLVQQTSGIKCNNRNGHPIYWGEKDIGYYFSKSLHIYSDKISKYIVETNEKTNGAVIDRISRIFSRIFLDEVQDLAGWDLEIVKLLLFSKSEILMVGDPRQVTYLTHHPIKHKKYIDGNIKEFIEVECNKKKNYCLVDDNHLNKSHRNNQAICDFSSLLFPNFKPSEPCTCQSCNQDSVDHKGIFLIHQDTVDSYLSLFNPVQLRWDRSKKVNENYQFYNFGQSKGLTFDRVLIYPTVEMKKWLLNNNYNLKCGTRSKFYVAITRARYSVGIVLEDTDKFSMNKLIRIWEELQ